MNWTILNVSIPVYDLKKSKQFYDMLIGYNENQKLLYQSLYKNEENILYDNAICQHNIDWMFLSKIKNLSFIQHLFLQPFPGLVV